MPVLLILVLGIIEMAMLLRDYTVVTADVRAGVRIAATGAGAGPGTCDVAPAPPCTTGASPKLAQMAADAIQRSGSAMPEDSINYILVYQANSDGFPGADGNTTMPTDCSATPNCVRFVWVAARNGFRYGGGTWDHHSIDACFPGTPAKPLERVGVFLDATHPTVTGAFFGATINISDHMVMDFEPLPAQTCAGASRP